MVARRARATHGSGRCAPLLPGTIAGIQSALSERRRSSDVDSRTRIDAGNAPYLTSAWSLSASSRPASSPRGSAETDANTSTASSTRAPTCHATRSCKYDAHRSSSVGIRLSALGQATSRRGSSVSPSSSAARTKTKHKAVPAILSASSLIRAHRSRHADASRVEASLTTKMRGTCMTLVPSASARSRSPVTRTCAQAAKCVLTSSRSVPAGSIGAHRTPSPWTRARCRAPSITDCAALSRQGTRATNGASAFNQGRRESQCSYLPASRTCQVT